MLSWLKFVNSPRAWKAYLLAILFFALALFSKTTACTLPAALILVLWLKKIPITKTRILQIVPFILMGLAMGLVSVWWERYHQGTQGQIFPLPLSERMLLACRALWFYAGKLLWPAHLSFTYPRWSISATDPLAYLWAMATICLAFAILLTRRFIGRGVEVAILFFAASLSPLLGFLTLYTFRFSFVADHYQYLASVGPLALVASGIETGFLIPAKQVHFLRPAVYAVVLLSLGTLTWRQCGMYRDIETLWRATIASNPKSWMAQNNLGITLLNTRRTEEAIAHFQQALRIQPDYAAAHDNLGNAYLRLGQSELSLDHLKQAVALDPADAEARNNLGNTLLHLGRHTEAAAAYQEALRIDPNYAEAHINLGALALQNGRADDSLAHLQKALQIDPESADAQNNLGNTLLQLGRAGEAVSHYNRALELQLGNVRAQNNLAWLLATSPDARIRNGARAVELSESADRSTAGQNPVIAATLAAAYAEAGRFPEAVQTAQRAIDLATRTENLALADAIRAQLALYESGMPSRDNPSSLKEH